MNRYDQLRADFEKKRQSLGGQPTCGIPVPDAGRAAGAPSCGRGLEAGDRAGVPELSFRTKSSRRWLWVNLGLGAVDLAGLWLLLAG